MGVFKYNGLDFKSFVHIVLACGDLFLHVIVIVEKKCNALDVVLVAVITCDLINGVA